MELNFQLAEEKDQARVIQFLAANDLPVTDLQEENVQLFLTYDEEELVATIGLEQHENMGLLRSLAVKETHRNQQLAEKLINGFFAVCESQNITDVYLLTTTAEKYFLKKGFVQVERKQVPAQIQLTREFRSICPSSAVVMHRQVQTAQCCQKR